MLLSRCWLREAVQAKRGEKNEQQGQKNSVQEHYILGPVDGDSRLQYKNKQTNKQTIIIKTTNKTPQQKSSTPPLTDTQKQNQRKHGSVSTCGGYRWGDAPSLFFPLRLCGSALSAFGPTAVEGNSQSP